MAKNIIESQLQRMGEIVGEKAWKAMTPKRQLAYLYAYYEFFHANDGDIQSLKEADMYDPHAEDGVVGVYEDKDSDNRNYAAVVPVHFGDYAPNELRNSIVNLLHSAEKALVSAVKRSYDARQALIAFFKDEGITEFSKEKPLKILLVTKEKLKHAELKKIRSFVEKEHSLYSNVSFGVVFGKELEADIIQTESPNEYVDTGIINIESSDNVCVFGPEKSLISNISALSLKKLYEQFGFAGLFAQNLRYYVRNTRVDDSIQNSIESQSDLFWYYNNGIIIICDDYEICSDNTIKLAKFSIINGGQTTKLIGESDIKKDFYLQCKIIKNKYSDENEKLRFISDVAEASNTQKPIKTKDLIANRPEQRTLKLQFKDFGVFCQIKRGEKVNKRIYKEPWQNTTNEEIGQLLLSFMYQEPGVARNSPAQITGIKNELIFGKIKSATDTYDTKMLIDLLKFKALYGEWKDIVKKNDLDERKTKTNLSRNGLMFMTSIVGLVAKYYFNRGFVKMLAEKVTREDKVNCIRQFDINNMLFVSDILNPAKKNMMFRLLDILYKEIFLPAYEGCCDQREEPIPYSNFTKTDKNYSSFVLPKFIWYFKSNPIENGAEDGLNKLVGSLFHSMTQKEFEANQNLANRYENNGTSTRAARISDSLVLKKLKADLSIICKKAAIKANVKNSAVMTGKQISDLARFAPQTLDELSDLKISDNFGIANEIFNAIATYLPAGSDIHI